MAKETKPTGFKLLKVLAGLLVWSKLKKWKYRVEQRTYNGIVYHSEAESVYAAQLDRLKCVGAIIGWERQVEFPLGDTKTVVGFVVTEWRDKYVVEIKGVELPEFETVKKLWREYGPLDMHVMKRVGNRWQDSVIQGAEC